MADSKTVGVERNEKIILVVGMACTDLILTCPNYPVEDSIIRALDSEKRRGGNASNTCSVLSQLNIKCELLGSFGGDDGAVFLKKDLEESGILFNHSPTYKQYVSPFTYLIMSLASGSRTGLHYRGDFPENLYSDFCKVDLFNYSWIHFEGRHVLETQKMIASINEWNLKQSNRKVQYSIELERRREETKQFMPLADFIFVSKDYALYLGFEDMISTINGISPYTKAGAVIIVPWDIQGAMARCANGDIVSSPAFPPAKVLDTVGAGDTFIAGTITALSKQKSVKEAIGFGCKVAGYKVGMTGFKGLGDKMFGLDKTI